jgi:hypothetical protein
VLWLVLAILPALGVNPPAVHLLSFLTFAQGGMFGGALGAVGGILGKAVFAYFFSAMILPLLMGKKPFRGMGRGLKSFFPGLAVQSAAMAAQLLLGLGLALVVFNFLSGNAGLINSMAGVVGFFLALRSLWQRGGFFWGLALSVANKLSRGRVPSAVAVSRVVSGYAAGSALGVALSAVPWPYHPVTAYLPYLAGGALFLIGLILSLAVRPQKGWHPHEKEIVGRLVNRSSCAARSSVTAAAELLDKDANPPKAVSSGSFESTSGTRMDFGVSGGDLTGAKWSYGRHYAIYTLTGTCKEGETLSLSVTGTPAPGVDDALVWNVLSAKLTFRDGDAKIIGEEPVYDSGTVKSSPLSHEIGAAFPSGAKTVDINGTFKCRWASPYTVVEESVAVMVNLTLAEEEPAAAAPVIPTPRDPGPAEPSSEPAAEESESALEPGPSDTDAPDEDNPWAHAGPLATALISAAALAAVFGAAAASAAGGAAGGAGFAPEPQSMVLTTTNGAQILVVRDPVTGDWINSETGNPIDISRHEEFVKQQEKALEQQRARDAELERTGQTAMQQASTSWPRRKKKALTPSRKKLTDDAASSWRAIRNPSNGRPSTPGPRRAGAALSQTR